MSTFHKEFESITSETLQELIASGTVETIQLEYKQEVNNLVSLTEELCAFANTRGGDLFVGIIEDQGAASGFRGISNPDIDAEKLRYTNAIIGNTDPALTQVRIRHIRLDNGENILHLRVNRSFNRPHMVTANNKFPIRVGTQKIAAGVPEIRRLFSGSQEFQHAYERFRVRRIEKALNVYRLPAPSLLIHYVPLTAFDLENEYPVIDKIDTLQAPVFGYTAANPLINVDGIINRAKSEEAGFTQIFRNGIIELGTSNVFFRDETRSNPPVEMSLVEFATLITANLEIQLKNYKRLSMQDPFYLIVNLIGVNGVHGDVQQRNRHYTAIQLDDDFIQLPELWLDPEAGVDPTADLRPLLRTLWNAFGMDHAI